MKILYVTTISGTVNAFLIPHIKFLIKQGNQVDVACNHVQELSGEIKEYGCRIHQVEFQRNPLDKKNFSAYKKIKNLIIEEGYELIHVHTPVASFLTRLACRNIKNIYVLYTAHGFHFFKGAPKINWIMYHSLEKIAARWTDGLITMNNEDFQSAEKLKLRKRNSIYKVHGVGLDLSRFIPQTSEEKMNLRIKYRYNPEDFILIYVAELSYRKHQDLLIEAIGKVKGQLKDLKLLLVGDGELTDSYKELVKSLGLEKNVEFLGYRKDIHELLTISDIAISTSRQEGLPVNIMEAMATGLPIIVTDCRGNRDLISNGVNGLVIGINDVTGCAQAIERLYFSEVLRYKFSSKNKELIEIYSLKHVIYEMEKIYSKEIIETVTISN